MRRKFDPYEDVLDLCTTPYQVLPMARGADTVATRFIADRHYMRGCARAQSAVYGLFDGAPLPDDSNLLGVLMFARSCSEAVCGAVFGEELKRHVTELHRLYVADGTPINTESFFIARALRHLREVRPDLWGVISFADPSAGHGGYIYRATNADFTGMTRGGKPQYTDTDGRIRHVRQCGVNISREEAAARGWAIGKTSGKYRYLFLNASDRRQLRDLRDRNRMARLPYPCTVLSTNGNRGNQ